MAINTKSIELLLEQIQNVTHLTFSSRVKQIFNYLDKEVKGDPVFEHYQIERKKWESWTNENSSSFLINWSLPDELEEMKSLAYHIYRSVAEQNDQGDGISLNLFGNGTLDDNVYELNNTFLGYFNNAIEEIINTNSIHDNERGVSVERLKVTNDTIERAIQDVKILIEKNGVVSAVDRIHTVLHGYLYAVCKQSDIMTAEEETLTQLFKKLKTNHPELQENGEKQRGINQIINSFSNVLDKLSPFRNKASLSHPNEELLDEDEAWLVVNSAITILNYLNRKIPLLIQNVS